MEELEQLKEFSAGLCPFRRHANRYKNMSQGVYFVKVRSFKSDGSRQWDGLLKVGMFSGNNGLYDRLRIYQQLSDARLLAVITTTYKQWAEHLEKLIQVRFDSRYLPSNVYIDRKAYHSFGKAKHYSRVGSIYGTELYHMNHDQLFNELILMRDQYGFEYDNRIDDMLVMGTNNKEEQYSLLPKISERHQLSDDQILKYQNIYRMSGSPIKHSRDIALLNESLGYKINFDEHETSMFEIMKKQKEI